VTRRRARESGVRYNGFMSAHRRAEETSLRLHAAVAERLAADPTRVADARRRVERWIAEESVAREYAEAWLTLLTEPLPVLVERIVERSERMHDLRQVSPFAGVLDPRTRWRVRRASAP
jgi:hypothetical protein